MTIGGNGKAKQSSSGDEATATEGDIFRDYPVRYLGYANEVGEAFRSFVHVGLVRLSYAVSTCYVIADAAHKGQIANKKFSTHPEKTSIIAQSVADTLLWQGLASVIIPGFTINRICWMSTRLLSKRMSLNSSKGISTAIGLAAIPFIIRPIDTSVDMLMETTFRQIFSNGTHGASKRVVHHNRDD
ncbi:MTFP1 [Bugula neritina]|uniref:Mitochondrial fission process protein 1 n=1 Tax=Bugula neritina TaxID=10212 RepID=A0A7J7JWE1_BUGNE|nr:MTFP1 [Bugula neritina]